MPSQENQCHQRTSLVLTLHQVEIKKREREGEEGGRVCVGQRAPSTDDYGSAGQTASATCCNLKPTTYKDTRVKSHYVSRPLFQEEKIYNTIWHLTLACRHPTNSIIRRQNEQKIIAKYVSGTKGRLVIGIYQRKGIYLKNVHDQIQAIGKRIQSKLWTIRPLKANDSIMMWSIR